MLSKSARTQKSARKPIRKTYTQTLQSESMDTMIGMMMEVMTMITMMITNFDRVFCYIPLFLRGEYQTIHVLYFVFQSLILFWTFFVFQSLVVFVN